VIVRRMASAVAVWLGLGMSLCVAAPAAYGDTVYLKSGEVRVSVVERFSDGAFWIREGRKTVIYMPDDILKIVFDPASEIVLPTRSALPRTPALAPGKSPAPERPISKLMSIPSADASDSGAVIPDLAILNYQAQFTSGVFQIVGDVENRRAAPARYVKVSIFLLDGSGTVVDQNFSFVHPDPPHLDAGQSKRFKVSFLNPPARVSKYKIRVESSPF